MPTATTASGPLKRAAEITDPDIVGTLAGTYSLWLDALTEVADRPDGHPDLEGFTKEEIAAEIRAIQDLERAFAAPAAARADPIDWSEFQRFLQAIGRDRGPLVLSLFPPDPSKPCIHIPCEAEAMPKQWIEHRQEQLPELALGLVMNHPLPRPTDWGTKHEHLNPKGKPRAWGASKSHISHAIGIWAECDGGLPLEAQQALPELAGLPEPSLAVWSGSKSLHLYWLVEPGEVLEPDTFEALQQRLAQRLAEVAPEARPDCSISNVNRVMRAPGGNHPKTGNPCRIHNASEQRFTVAQLLKELPEPEPTPAPAPAAPAPGLSDAVSVAQLLPRDQLRAWEQGVGEGQRNSTAFSLACQLLALHEAAAAAGLATAGSPEDALLEFAGRCSPPLPEQEVVSTFRSACSATRTTDPGWPDRLRWHLNQRHRQQRPQHGAAAPPGDGGAAAQAGEPTGMDWLLQRLDTGAGPAEIRKTTAGDLAQTLLLVARDRLRFNQQTLVAEIDGEPIEGPALDTLHVELQLRGLNITGEAAVAAVATAALRRPFHPVRQYLDRVATDESIEPLDLTALAGRFLRPGDAAGTLHGRMLAKTLIGAVARAYQPGCKLDTITVLVGEQGAQKSTFWEGLASPAFYTSSSVVKLDKDSLLIVHASWFIEAAELETLTSKRAAGELKNFLSTATDCFRTPYGKTVQRRPRPSIMVGTSNRSDFLADETGSRRFWIIPVTAPEIDVAAVKTLRDQIWKSAVLAYRAGERWWLDRADAAASEIENQAFSASHPWEAPVAAWLERQGSKPFSTIDCLTRAELRDQTQISRRDEMALATVLAGMGWKQQRVLRGGKKVRIWVQARSDGPTWTDLDQPQTERSVHKNASDSSGSQPLDRPDQPKNKPLPEAVPVGGNGTAQSKGTKKGRSGRSIAETPTGAVDLPGPTSPAKVGPGWSKVGPAPLKPWHPVALELHHANPGAHAFSLALLLEQQGFPGVSGREVAQLLQQQEVAA